MEFKDAVVGDTVVFNILGEEQHEELPNYYPTVGTEGVIISVTDFDALIDWDKSGGTDVSSFLNDHCRWWCEFNFFDKKEV